MVTEETTKAWDRTLDPTSANATTTLPIRNPTDRVVRVAANWMGVKKGPQECQYASEPKANIGGERPGPREIWAIELDGSRGGV